MQSLCEAFYEAAAKSLIFEVTWVTADTLGIALMLHESYAIFALFMTLYLKSLHTTNIETTFTALIMQSTAQTKTLWYMWHSSYSYLSTWNFKKPIPYETGDVDMNKSSHQVLTIKAIHYTTVPRDCVCKIL